MKVPLLKAGRYVVAVSGGVDSVVLLHLLQQQPGLDLVVAHFDHGIRPDSHRDAELVAKLAQQYSLPFYSQQAKLGPVSEEVARTARYKFLHDCRKKFEARAIVTAHHQDDVLETIIINYLRGTGWRGLSSLRSHTGLMRPLLEVTKAQIEAYAKAHNLQWHLDITNADLKYLRNYVREQFMPRLNQTTEARTKLLKLWRQQCQLVDKITQENANLLQNCLKTDGYPLLDRYFLIMAPPEVAYELLQSLMHRLTAQRLEPANARAVLHFAKTAKPGKWFRPRQDIICQVNARNLIVKTDEI